MRVATELFAEKGYEATTLQDLAAALGIFKAGLYYYVDSKEDLLFRILQEGFEGLLPQLDEWRNLPGNALDKLRAFVEGFVVYGIVNRERNQIFAHDFRSLSPARRSLVIKVRDRYDRFVEDLLQEGQKEKTISADIDPKLTAAAIFGMVNSLYLWYRPRGGRSPEEIAASFARLVVNGAAAETAGEQSISAARSSHRRR